MAKNKEKCNWCGESKPNLVPGGLFWATEEKKQDGFSINYLVSHQQYKKKYPDSVIEDYFGRCLQCWEKDSENTGGRPVRLLYDKATSNNSHRTDK